MCIVALGVRILDLRSGSTQYVLVMNESQRIQRSGSGVGVVRIPTGTKASSLFRAVPKLISKQTTTHASLVRSIIFILGVCSATLHANPQLTAHYTPNFSPKQALHDKGLWSGIPAVTLRGADNKPTASATMRVVWNEKAAFFIFNAVDNSIVSPGKRDGLEQYRIGDTAEVFMGRRGERAYVEVHATPTGKKTLYFYRDYLIAMNPPSGADRIRVISTQTTDGWRAIFTIPWEVFGGREARKGWDVFFGRYDYDELGGRERLASFPVLGKKPNFHHRKKYGVLHFQR